MVPEWVSGMDSQLCKEVVDLQPNNSEYQMTPVNSMLRRLAEVFQRHPESLSRTELSLYEIKLLFFTLTLCYFNFLKHISCTSGQFMFRQLDNARVILYNSIIILCDSRIIFYNLSVVL
jgi:hypothetical protein